MTVFMSKIGLSLPRFFRSARRGQQETSKKEEFDYFRMKGKEIMY